MLDVYVNQSNNFPFSVAPNSPSLFCQVPSCGGEPCDLDGDSPGRDRYAGMAFSFSVLYNDLGIKLGT
jgi:hypothetical protein